MSCDGDGPVDNCVDTLRV